MAVVLYLVVVGLGAVVVLFWLNGLTVRDGIQRILHSVGKPKRQSSPAVLTKKLSPEQEYWLREFGTADMVAYEAFSRGQVVTDADEQIRCHTQAISSDPSYVRAYYARALAYERKNDHVSAIADCRRLLALDPNHPNAYGVLAAAYWANREYSSARDTIEAARAAGLESTIPAKLLDTVKRTPVAWLEQSSLAHA